MFRPMLRKKQALTKEECEKILETQLRGVLSLIGDDGYPYGLPINHYYCKNDEKIYFHCGKKGHKIDAIKQSNKASFCVFDEGYKKENEWALNIKSVIVFGKIEFVEDKEEIYRISRLLSLKFTPDEEYIQKEIEKSGPATMMFALTPEHISGKLVKEE